MPTSRRPNVLWIMSDQHNANCMSHGGRNVRTPHLDALAERGVRFQQAFCNNPICAPSRVSFITGQYPHTHGHLGNHLIDYPEGNPHTVSALARRYGYQTAMIGKAHMIRKWDDEGFEHIRYCDLCDADRNDPLTCHYFKHLRDKGLVSRYDLGTLPKDHPGKFDHWFVSEIPHAHSLEVWTANETIQFLQNRDKSRPFFVQMSFQRPHAPLSPSVERSHMYKPQDIDIPRSAKDLFESRFETKPTFQKTHVEQRGGYPYVPLDEDELRKQLTHYYALVSIIDEEIGRTLDCLQREGELENTVIVYAADHGDFAGDHGLMQKNFGIYESIHRIPFLLAYPGCPQGSEIDEIVESVDLYPTLCHLLDLPEPDALDGQDLVPLIKGGSPGKDAALCEWSWGKENQKILALRDREFRLVYYGSGKEGELYDRRADPDELNNVYEDPNYESVRLELTEKLLDRVARHGCKTNMTTDREEARRTRNSMTNLLHKRAKSWEDVEELYES